MRDPARVSTSDKSPVSMSDSSCDVSLSAFGLDDVLSFSNDRHSQQLRDPRQELERVADSLFPQDSTTFEIPTACFSDLSKAVFVETAAVARRTPRVSVRVIRADATKRPSELFGDVSRSLVADQVIQVIPGSVSCEQRQSIGGTMPQRVRLDLERNTLGPRLILFLERHAALLARKRSHQNHFIAKLGVLTH
jgi:hypothetical protein